MTAAAWLRSVSLFGAWVATAAVGGQRASAQALDDGPVVPPPPASGVRSVDSGAFSPWSMAARSDSQQGMIHMTGGYDGARGGVLFEQNSESRITGRLSVRAGFGYGSTAQAGGPYLGLKVDALRQEHHGVDVAFAGSYEFDSFNRVPAARLAGAVGGLVGGTRLLANVAYGQGMELDERHADVRVAALRPLGRRIHLGVDSRVRLDLEHDASEPAGEPEWDLMMGPHAAISLKTFVISALAGAAAVRFREGGDTKVGALVSTGVGAVF